MSRTLILGTMALLLLFGCAGQQGQANPPGAPTGVSAGGGSQIQVGDSDISPEPTVNESDTLSNEPVASPDNGTAMAGNGTNQTAAQQGNLSAGSLPDDSDLIVENTTNEDLISQQDVVEPP